MIHIEERVREVWRDHLLPTDTDWGRMFVSRPTPAPEPDEDYRLHVIFEVNRPQTVQGQRTRAVLFAFQELSQEGPSPDIRWCPAIVDPPVTLADVARISGTIRAEHLLMSLGTPDRQWMGPYHGRNVDHGHYLPVWWDLRRRPFTTSSLHPALGDSGRETSYGNRRD